MTPMIECVPNFSEGRDRDVISAITAAMEPATVLDVDMGASTNRTVVTMAGPPGVVEDAAFEAIRVAAERIDMSRHRGEHPRIGATDVCPFVPLAGATIADCVKVARRLGERVGGLGIPVYLYEEAATTPSRRSLAEIRKGEYEGLAAKLTDPEWVPDYGPAAFNARSGATVIGAREFLIAWNIDLNTRDKALATRIAIRLRGSGGAARAPDGERYSGPDGTAITLPGLFDSIRAVGWVIEDYGIAQVSINLVNYRKAPIHLVFEEARRIASDLGVSVTGSEVVGLIPKAALLDAGRFYLDRQGRSPGAPEPELIHTAVRSLGLSDARPFVPEEKVIELRLAAGRKTLMDKSVTGFLDDVSADSPTPGGGSVAALCGALGAGLAAMVGNLTVRRPDLSAQRGAMAAMSIEAQSLKERLARLVVEDSDAFEAVLAANRLAKRTDSEKEARQRAVMEANVKAASTPLAVIRLAGRVAELALTAATTGYENCVSDAGVAAAACVAAGEGAYLNVLINVKSLDDQGERDRLLGEAGAALDALRRAAVEALAVARRRAV